MDVTMVSACGIRLTKHMAAEGYSADYVDDARRLVDWACERCPSWGGWDDAFEEVAERWHEGNGKTRSRMERHLWHLMLLAEHGELPRPAGRRGRMMDRDCARRRLSPAFASVLEAYERSEAAARKKPGTVAGEVSCAASFLERLQAAGVTGPSSATEDVVLSITTGPDGGPLWSGGLAQRIRAVLVGAREVDGCERLASLIPVPRRWRKAHEPLSPDERDRVLAVLDGVEGDLSPGDRAIGRILFHTGMRPCDVAALRLDSFDWVRDEICFVQQKTGVRVRLPLTAQVGNAVIDYAECERGQSGSAHLFVSLSWPHDRLTAYGVRDVAKKLLAAAGVDTSGGRGCARLFRRTVASSMSSDGTDRAVIAATLGHASEHTTERYVSADVESLRRCALDVSAFPVKSGVLS